MSRKTPIAREDSLVWRDGDEERSITIGTPAWFTWLEQATVFSFVSPLGTFTACKERFQRGGRYWRAYRKRLGKVHRAYLGKSEALTLTRLNQVAAALAAMSTSGESPAPCPPSSGRDPGDSRVAPARSPFPQVEPQTASKHEGYRSPLLTTKLLLPPARGNVVSRPRLAERLNDVLQHKLTLISAPAGTGKTTLLSQWIGIRSCPVAWISLDPADDDPARFWAYFIAALQSVHLGVAASVLDLIRSPEVFPVESSLTPLINALAAAPVEFALVLDDYHTIESPAIHRGMNYLLDHLPPQVHLVIATRIDPPLALARLRGKGQMMELRSADLGFTREEADTFLNQVMKLDLSLEEVATLDERTEGWAVGLQVAALSLRGRQDKAAFIKAFAGEHRHIIDYLTEEVLWRQSEAVQSFLLQTSVLDRLSAPLCEAVTGQPEGQAMLETLERANLFTVPLDGERHWYRYHRLFADFLRGRLHQSQPEEIVELHRRACAWYARHDLPDEAVSHALAAKDYALAADLMEQGGPQLRRRGEMATIFTWLRSLPEELLCRRPRLCLLHAWALASTSDLDAAEARLKQAESNLATDGNPSVAIVPESPSAGAQQITDEVLALRIQIASFRGDWRRAIHLGQQALERASGLERGLGARIMVNLGTAYWWSGDIVRASEAFAKAGAAAQTAGEISGAVSSLCNLASAQRMRGHLHDSAKIYGQALRLVSEQVTDRFLYSGWPHLGLGRLHYEWNDLPSALHYANKSIRQSEDVGVPLLLLAGYTLLARVKQAEGDVDGALEINRQTLQLANLHDNRREIPRLMAFRARLWLMQGNIDAALRWARESGLRADDQPSYKHETEHMVLAQTLIAKADAVSALGLLERLRQAAEAAGRVGSVVKILVLQAVAIQARGATDEAMVPLEQALLLAQPEGYVRTFVDRGAPVAALLCRLLQSDIWHRTTTGHSLSQPYVRSLLLAFQRSALEHQGDILETTIDQGETKPLSDREFQVLQLIAAGRSTPEIARELVVSLNTVKTHLKNIYGKLNAHSAKEAAARARDLKLL